MKTFTRIAPLLFFIFFYIPLIASFHTDWRENNKDENGIVLDQRQDVIIAINQHGELEIQSRISEEIEYFNDNATLYSNQSIGYSHTFSEIKDIQAFSLVPQSNNKFKKIPVTEFKTSDARTEGIFYDDQKKIAYIFPALKTGVRTSLTYTKKFREPRFWGYYLFSSYFPVKNSTYTITAPENVKLKYLIKGIEEERLTFTKEQKGKNVIYKWTTENLDKIRMGRGAEGILQSAAHLIVHVESYEYNGQKFNLLGDVNDLHAWYQNFLKGLDSNEDDNMAKMVENIIQGKTTELEKVEAIYYWVQQNIKYIAIEDGLGGFKPRQATTVFNRRYGDCKDMSNLLHNMLKIANIPSNLAWIGTTSIPYTHKEVPTPMADNHMICTYLHDGNYYFLDATDQYNKLGTPTTHIQGQEALVHKGVGDFELIPVPVVAPEGNQVIDSANIYIEGTRIFGNGKATYTGYQRLPVTNNLENLTSADKESYLHALLRKGNNKFSLATAKTDFLADRNHDLSISYDFNISDYIINSSGEIIINPHLNRELQDGIIDIKSKRNNIYMPYKSLTTKVVTLTVPDGYKIASLPNSASFDMDAFGFNLAYDVFGDKITISQVIRLNTLQVVPEQFESWNRMVRGLFSAYRESIVLQKIES